MNNRGYFGIGVYHPKAQVNIGTLWRSAYQLGAQFIFTVGRRYGHQASDTYKAPKQIPLFHMLDIDELWRFIPHGCPVVAIEMGGITLPSFYHPKRAIYLLGAEDHGLPQDVLDRCHQVVSIPSVRVESYNVAQAGTLVMYDRMVKRE